MENIVLEINAYKWQDNSVSTTLYNFNPEPSSCDIWFLEKSKQDSKLTVKPEKIEIVEIFSLEIAIFKNFKYSKKMSFV